ncbi:hypothetical protein yc1106_08264 [Curvularia clavata]|uniref:AAA+ ATPase domain-containing protein n=1 Tax=Curvularia clavata TaxID=95742 RepID=A0A9Q8ZFX5_CURCL|nr:hypothetical protein yc1106_08264 [Curvularia clavata]
MRLLHFDTLGRLVLTDFRGKPIPPYAVLSHRWSDSEILMEDIANEMYREREEGYKKLIFCAEQVARDELQYFWIDTCCIDRWNNNERSKAINSMFQWYKNAARCYVFLSDVSASTSTSTLTSTATESVLCRDWDVPLRRSKWFTRGWTLQELIAPASVEFFSCEGQRIGDKTSLGQLLHSITGIPLAALRNCPLDQFSISERMRWVSGRETTETEDMVYCLLGLLGVSMPITYGERRESALERLQAEVEGADCAPSIIPFSRNKSFVGRELQLAELEAKLFSNTQNSTSMLAIVGPSGTGKSQLALEVAHRTLKKQKHCSVFWIDASDKDSLNQSYTSIAQKLGIPGYNNDQVDIEQIVKRCIAELNTRQCLLIFDNVEGTTVQHGGSLAAETTDLANFLPQSKLCSVIFTTTESDTARTLAPQDVVALRELTPDTALRMLQSRLSTPLSNAEQPGAIRLLRELSHLPLAVSQAAACINASNMTVQQYQARLHEYNQAALKHSDDLREGEHGESGLRKAVAATLSLSIGQVRQSNAIAVEQLYFAACVDRKDIPLDLLEAASPQARVDAIMTLDRSKWRRLLPHAQYVLSHSEKNDDEERTNLAEDCAGALRSDGQYKRAEELYIQVMESRRRVLGNHHPDTLASINNLGLVLLSQGKYDEAEVINRRALEAREKLIGREHPDTLSSVNNLGSVLLSQGKYEEAEVMLRQVLEVREKLLGREDPRTLISVSNLGPVLLSQGRYEEAEEMERRALEAREKLFGREHPDTLISASDLGSVLESQGKYEEAEVIHRRTLEAREKLLGREHPDTLISVNNLGSVLLRQGKYEEVEVMHRRVLEVRERLLGCEHPDTLISVNNLGIVLSRQGKYKEAELMHRRDLEASEKVLGPEHPDTFTSVYYLADLLAMLGDYKESLNLYTRACDGYNVVLGEHHPTTQACRQHRSEVLLHMSSPDWQVPDEEAEAWEKPSA